MFLLNICVWIFSHGALSSAFTGDMNNTAELGFGFTINETSQEINPPNGEWLLSTIIPLLAVGVVVTGVAFATGDISAGLRVAVGIFFTYLSLNTMTILMQIPDMPFVFKVMFGMILGVLYIISLIGFVAGSDL